MTEWERMALWFAFAWVLARVLSGCATTHDADLAQPPVYLASDLTPEHAEAVAAAVQEVG